MGGVILSLNSLWLSLPWPTFKPQIVHWQELSLLIRIDVLICLHHCLARVWNSHISFGTFCTCFIYVWRCSGYIDGDILARAVEGRKCSMSRKLRVASASGGLAGLGHPAYPLPSAHLYLTNLRVIFVNLPRQPLAIFPCIVFFSKSATLS